MNFRLHVCLILGSLVWKLVSIYWFKLSSSHSNRKQRFYTLQNFRLGSELKMTILPNKTKPTLKPSFPKIKHMSRLKFFYLGLPNVVSKPTFSNMCGLPPPENSRWPILQLNQVTSFMFHFYTHAWAGKFKRSRKISGLEKTTKDWDLILASDRCAHWLARMSSLSSGILNEASFISKNVKRSNFNELLVQEYILYTVYFKSYFKQSLLTCSFTLMMNMHLSS